MDELRALVEKWRNEYLLQDGFRDKEERRCNAVCQRHADELEAVLASPQAQRESQPLNALLPETYLADRDVLWRVERIIGDWRRLIEVNKQLEERVSQAEAGRPTAPVIASVEQLAREGLIEAGNALAAPAAPLQGEQESAFEKWWATTLWDLGTGPTEIARRAWNAAERAGIEKGLRQALTFCEQAKNAGTSEEDVQRAFREGCSACAELISQTLAAARKETP
jgi:hypothetical protein